MSDKIDPRRCAKWVNSGERWDMRGHQCGRKPVKDGLCGQHQPDALAAQAAKQAERYEARRKAEDALHEQRAVTLLRSRGYTVTPPASPGSLQGATE